METRLRATERPLTLSIMHSHLPPDTVERVQPQLLAARQACTRLTYPWSWPYL